MKKLFIVALILLPIASLAQESQWTKQELKVLESFGLQTNDIRGVIFTEDTYQCDVEAKTEKEAILAYLQPEGRKDIIRVCTTEFDENYTDRILDIHQVIQLYILKEEKK